MAKLDTRPKPRLLLPLPGLSATRPGWKPPNSLHSFASAAAVARIAARAGRWLLPWACGLLLSATLVSAAEQALVHNPPNPPVVTVAAAPALAGLPTQAGARWVLLSTLEAQGTENKVVCLTTAGRIAPDTLTVQADDLDAVVAELCTAWFTDQATTSDGRRLADR